MIRFVQRFAVGFATFAGILGYKLILPDDAAWWLELLVFFAIAAPIYLLLQKDGVTYNRSKRR